MTKNIRTMYIPIEHAAKAELLFGSINGRAFPGFDLDGRLDRIIFEGRERDDGPLEFIHGMNIGAYSYPADAHDQARFMRMTAR